MRRKEKIYINSLAGYPTGYRISGHFSNRCNLKTQRDIEGQREIQRDIQAYTHIDRDTHTNRMSVGLRQRRKRKCNLFFFTFSNVCNLKVMISLELRAASKNRSYSALLTTYDCIIPMELVLDGTSDWYKLNYNKKTGLINNILLFHLLIRTTIQVFSLDFFSKTWLQR